MEDNCEKKHSAWYHLPDRLVQFVFFAAILIAVEYAIGFAWRFLADAPKDASPPGWILAVLFALFLAFINDRDVIVDFKV